MGIVGEELPPTAAGGAVRITVHAQRPPAGLLDAFEHRVVVVVVIGEEHDLRPGVE
ncbi:hypothetical protein ACFT8W_03705 [Streptomyces hygroscopicus]|uniref:hypothetical protein n=1 Tax=Streptomyces hygroscopicus TaxID=1912 RepID=UPI003625784D